MSQNEASTTNKIEKPNPLPTLQVKRLVVAMASDSFRDGRRPSHMRALTEKDSALFEEQVSKFQAKLLQSRRLLDLALEERTSEHNISLDTLRVKQNKVAQLLYEYESLSSEYLNYLSRNYHADSQREAAAHKLVLSSVKSRVYAVLHGIYVVQDSLTKKSSLKSISVSHKDTVSSSQGSMSSSRILKQRCKVQAAKAELAFLRQETDLQREKALVLLQQNNINSELKILAKAKEAAVAKSEHNVLCDMDYEKK